MIDAAILPLQRRLMLPPARALAQRGVRADQITLVGLAIGLAAAGAAALGLFALALAGLILNRLADGLDGAVARLTQPTDRGAYLDIALDFVFYAAFPLGFALHDPAANALPAAILLASFILSRQILVHSLSAPAPAPVVPFTPRPRPVVPTRHAA
jgi:phosphatidylglycerophosphate synthase